MSDHQENKEKLIRVELHISQIKKNIQQLTNYVKRIEQLEKKQHQHEHDNKTTLRGLEQLRKECETLKNKINEQDRQLSILQDKLLYWETLAKPTIAMFKKFAFTVIGLMTAGVAGFLFALFEMYIKTK